ncbi:hypothetical protein CEUSTIGMA_g836.t1 [Chlamydomonas eustigma]|uniref:Fibronectin type-III domain-containing protein n=1 Tax=Chlamydomonas eustigma TaxID=1157962 RepID=A0A250WRE4_9CHLO|nr:hypothetical protein CEUSTIGMA_g836.t1 [Chlamydomonas eustigma]|eukprot:GAX73383.1 hypothetical protein CEUSTIGMA_g836.t1 [Chlamydomonas eustigma]
MKPVCLVFYLCVQVYLFAKRSPWIMALPSNASSGQLVTFPFGQALSGKNEIINNSPVIQNDTSSSPKPAQIPASATRMTCSSLLPPGPPQNVTILQRNSLLLLNWDPPAHDSCVDVYVINLFLTTNGSVSKLPLVMSSTRDNHTSISGLKNGQQYLVTIQAYSSKFHNGGNVSVLATPTTTCNKSLTPGIPIGLNVQTGDRSAALCWNGVDNDACVDSYSVTAEPASLVGFRNSVNGHISTGACQNVTGLTNGLLYQFTVTASNAAKGPGPAASTDAKVGISTPAQQGWTCQSVNGCRPGSASFCEVSGCQAVSSMGGCEGPFMADVDSSTKQVTQWCGQVCTCDISMASIYGRPFSWGYQTLNVLFGGAQPGSSSPPLINQIAQSYSSTNPFLSNLIGTLGSSNGVTSSTGGGTPVITSLLSTAVSNNGGVSSLQSALGGAGRTPLLPVALNSFQGAVQGAVAGPPIGLGGGAASGLFPGSAAIGKVASAVSSTVAQNTASRAANEISSSEQAAGKVASAVTTQLVTQTVSGLIQEVSSKLSNGFNQLTSAG